LNRASEYFESDVRNILTEQDGSRNSKVDRKDKSEEGRVEGTQHREQSLAQ